MATAGSSFVRVSCVIRWYHVYKEVWSPNIGKNFVCSIAGSSYTALYVRLPLLVLFRKVYYAIPWNRSQKFYSNFRAAYKLKILEHFEAKLQKVYENYIFEFLEDLQYSFPHPT